MTGRLGFIFSTGVMSATESILTGGCRKILSGVYIGGVGCESLFGFSAFSGCDSAFLLTDNRHAINTNAALPTISINTIAVKTAPVVFVGIILVCG